MGQSRCYIRQLVLLLFFSPVSQPIPLGGHFGLLQKQSDRSLQVVNEIATKAFIKSDGLRHSDETKSDILQLFNLTQSDIFEFSAMGAAISDNVTYKDGTKKIGNTSSAAGFRTRDFACKEKHHRGMVLAFESGLKDSRAARKGSVLRVLEIVSRVLRHFQISWWLQGGSLIGAVREGGFIEWDLDGDIAMEWLGFLKLRDFADEISKKFLEPHKMYLDVYPRGCYGPPGIRQWLPARFWDSQTGFYVDVFAFGSSGRNLVNKDMSVHHNFTVPRALVFPLKTCPFNHLKLSCPAKPREYLDVLFGLRWNWKIPDHAEAWTESFKTVMQYIENLQAGHPTSAKELADIQKLILQI